MSRPVFLLALWLLAIPVAGEGWFDELRIEIRIEHSNAQEVQQLLSVLVPDTRYEVVGKTIVVRGSSLALEQVRELAAEFDRPLNQVVLDVRAFELSERSYKYLSRGSEPTFFVRKTRSEPAQDSVVGIWIFPYAHSDPALPFQDAKLLFRRTLESKLGDDVTFELPDAVASQLFKAERLRVKTVMDSLSLPRISSQLSFESGRRRWYARTMSPDGETLIIGNPATRCVVLLTPNLLR